MSDEIDIIYAFIRNLCSATNNPDAVVQIAVDPPTYKRILASSETAALIGDPRVAVRLKIMDVPIVEQIPGHK